MSRGASIACDPRAVTLHPIEHPRRLEDAAQASEMFRALGCDHVSVRGLHTRDAARIGRLVDAVEPSRQHTISFEDGVLGPDAAIALDALALTSFDYLDVRTDTGSLRIWPALRTWVHANGDAKPLETTDRAAASAAFRALSPTRVDRGFVNGLRVETKPVLGRFLAALAPRVDVVLDVPLATAASLTDLYGDVRAPVVVDWQADGVLVDFPSGRIHGFLTSSHNGPADRTAWLARIDRALAAR
jgi:hypothetical protein